MYTFNFIRKVWSPQEPAGSYTWENSPENTTNIWTSLTRIQYWCLEKSNPRTEQQTNSWVLFVKVERWFEHTFKLGGNKKDLFERRKQKFLHLSHLCVAFFNTCSSNMNDTEKMIVVIKKRWIILFFFSYRYTITFNG